MTKYVIYNQSIYKVASEDNTQYQLIRNVELFGASGISFIWRKKSECEPVLVLKEDSDIADIICQHFTENQIVNILLDIWDDCGNWQFTVRMLTQLINLELEAIDTNSNNNFFRMRNSDIKKLYKALKEYKKEVKKHCEQTCVL